ncbi:hypothetical protein BDN71DRAFT_1590974 [Pleurotus eryngii]|uniref:Uncharacterized protein n=1 Tax=Pleurotus eryngii TaxID=5323 RepID=A0A9P5ZU84_PLEER|nr:hypothetical protein BDN71DRAFT_1590974 [Pleurotus eryngii]
MWAETFLPMQLTTKHGDYSQLRPTLGEPDAPKDNGVLYIFFISRSCCVFVNFNRDGHLQTGIERFNGAQLQPNDPRCPKLVCRVRRNDDDLKAGIGGQRGSGVHMRWTKEQKKKHVDRQPAEMSSSDDPLTNPSEYHGQASTYSDEDG